jgi:hypothetical protein
MFRKPIQEKLITRIIIKIVWLKTGTLLTIYEIKKKFLMKINETEIYQSRSKNIILWICTYLFLFTSIIVFHNMKEKKHLPFDSIMAIEPTSNYTQKLTPTITKWATARWIYKTKWWLQSLRNICFDRIYIKVFDQN